MDYAVPIKVRLCKCRGPGVSLSLYGLLLMLYMIEIVVGAPRFGGLWEAAVKSAKYHFTEVHPASDELVNAGSTCRQDHQFVV